MITPPYAPVLFLVLSAAAAEQTGVCRQTEIDAHKMLRRTIDDELNVVLCQGASSCFAKNAADSVCVSAANAVTDTLMDYGVRWAKYHFPSECRDVVNKALEEAALQSCSDVPKFLVNVCAAGTHTQMSMQHEVLVHCLTEFKGFIVSSHAQSRRYLMTEYKKRVPRQLRRMLPAKPEPLLATLLFALAVTLAILGCCCCCCLCRYLRRRRRRRHVLSKEAERANNKKEKQKAP